MNIFRLGSFGLGGISFERESWLWWWCGGGGECVCVCGGGGIIRPGSIRYILKYYFQCRESSGVNTVRAGSHSANTVRAGSPSECDSREGGRTCIAPI